ncbi:MAG: carbohydrate binding domain-containing protein, partial [Candidatus Izemoplasmatales bacterium]
NIGFESGIIDPSSWVRNNNAEYIFDGSQSYSGNCAIKVSNTNSFVSENFISVIADNEYIIVAFLKALDASALEYSFKINWYDSSYSLLISENKNIEISTTYEKYISVFKAPSTANYMKLEWVGDNSSNDNWFIIDSVEFLNNVSTANLLINNSGFETINGSDPDGWIKIGSPEYSTNGSQSYNGNCAVKVSYENIYQSNQQISITAADEYIIGAYIKADGLETKCRFKIDWYDGSSQLISTSYEYFYVTSTYNHYYIKVVAPSNAITVNIVLDGDGINSSNWFWYDSIEVYDYDEFATNLISTENSDFENSDSDPDEWTRIGSPEYGHDSYEGLDSVKVSFGNSYSSDKYIVINDFDKYIVGARIKADGIATQCRILVEWYNDSYALLGSSYEDIIVTSDYKHYYTILTPESNSTYAKIILDGDGISSSNWFWYDNIEFYTYNDESFNMIFNSSFEIDNIENWLTNGSPEYSISGSDSYNGNCAVKVSYNNSCESEQFISVLESNEYIVGARIKADGIATQCRILVEWFDEYEELIGSSYENIIVTTDYNHYYIRVVSPASIVKYMKIMIDGDGINAANEFWYDSIEVYDYDESAVSLILGENPNFDNGKYIVEDWVMNGNPIYSTSGFDSYKGNDILKVSFNNNFESENFVNVVENIPYKISAFIKSESALTYQFRIDWYDSGYSLLSSSTQDVSVSNENFTECFKIVTAPTGAAYMKIVLDGDGVNSSNWFWVDKILILQVTQHNQFPIVLHYGYEYTLANLPANFAMADIVSGVSIDMAIQEILGNRYFDGSLPIASDGTNSVDRRLVELWDELHTHRHKGLISPRLEARDIDLINPPGVTTQKTVEDHVTLIGDGQADNNNPHGLSAKDIDVKLDEIPYPNEYSDDTLKAKTDIHGRVDVSIADHILEIGTGIPDSKNPHGLDSTDIEHNAETNPDNSFKTIEQALFDRVKDLHGDGIVRGLRIFAEDSNYIKITDGYAYVNGKRIRVGNSIVISELLVETETNKIFRITGALVNDLVYITYFDANNYYRWIAKVYSENGMLKVDISDANLSYNYNNIDILSYNNLKLDNNEKFEMQLNSNYQQVSIPNLS